MNDEIKINTMISKIKDIEKEFSNPIEQETNENKGIIIRNILSALDEVVKNED